MNLTSSYNNYTSSTDVSDWVKVKAPVKATMWEFLLIVTWFFSTATQFDGLEPLRYCCIAAMIGNALYYRHFLLKHSNKLWFLWLFPAWVLFSAFWSPSDQAIRFGLMHFLDIFVLIYIALRFSPQQIIKTVFYAYIPVGIVVFLHIPSLSPDNFPAGFSEKNYVASRMFFLLTTSLFVIFDKKSLIAERAASILFIPLCMLAIFKVESATAFALGTAAIIIMVAVGTIWKTISHIQSGRSVFLIASITISIITIGLLLSFSSTGPVEIILKALDKDPTLTGRTEIWRHGQSLIQQYPLFGLGAEGFWQVGRGDAENILYSFYKEEGTRFSFHNSYIEILVHLGTVGFLLFIMPVIYVCVRATTSWLKKQDITSTFFLLMAVLPLTRSMTESDLYNVFDMQKSMMLIAGLIGISYRRAYVSRRKSTKSAPR